MVSARLDDVANFLPARLSWLLLSLAAVLCREDGARALRTGWRDRYQHSSPNCAWPEATVAGALGIRLGGPNDYFGQRVEKPWIGDAVRDIAVDDISRTIRLMWVASSWRWRCLSACATGWSARPEENLMQYIQQPQAIEAKSFDIISEIIAETRPDYRFASPLHEAIIKRVIHTTADFDWLDILWFSPDALIALSEALSRPCTLYTDTTMALSGINKTLLARFGGECRCYISDPRVVREAQSRGMTRSMAAVDIAVQEPGEKVFVFGNAPTALFRLLEHRETAIGGVVGVPVGFVGAAESKAALSESGLPAIAALGRKGGSNVAAAIVNALLYHLREAQ
ncbi:cobalt-precorrin-8x methylmutase [Klebsiella pneumoniae subsp. ozaenae]|nr:cobalt-precorrin-8x methylmutase [Klebsiella pneumoniae subsp. ozaenae]